MLAFDGITRLNIKPLHMITSLGISASGISFIGIIWAIIKQILGHVVVNWASPVCAICFMSEIQLICLDVLREYIDKTYMEVKHIPQYE